MSSVHALALCRVSTDEQLSNNSLNQQRSDIEKAAKQMNVFIPDDGWYSGSVSSKRGTNLERKDLSLILARCKKDKRIKYLFVNEPDRFMRSIDEAAYFEVEFRRQGVEVYYASVPELNTGDLMSKLLKFTKYFAAEGSNEERQRKSIKGQLKALEEGRWPFNPKPGYKRGYHKGIPEIDEQRAPALKLILENIASGMITPTQALKQLNDSDFVQGSALYKMDKFRKIATDPFYAGILEVDKQVKFRNEFGLHEPLIPKEIHQKILKVFENKKKNQAGPRTNGNPKYPLNNIVQCDSCRDQRYGRVVGFDARNGKPNSKVYEKYRCRSCGLYLSRDDMHSMVKKLIKRIDPSVRALIGDALSEIWQLKERDSQLEKVRLQKRHIHIQELIKQQVIAATDPSNTSIRGDILSLIDENKSELKEIEDKIEEIASLDAAEMKDFVSFAFEWLDNIADNFLSAEISHEDRLRCKQILFPAGFRLDESKRVYTPELSPIYRVLTNKKDLSKLEKSLMVRVRRL